MYFFLIPYRIDRLIKKTREIEFFHELFASAWVIQQLSMAIDTRITSLHTPFYDNELTVVLISKKKLIGYVIISGIFFSFHFKIHKTVTNYCWCHTQCCLKNIPSIYPHLSSILNQYLYWIINLKIEERGVKFLKSEQNSF